MGVTVPPFSEPKVAENVCSTCFLVTGRGISHQCTQAAAVDNLICHCLKLGEYAEQITSAIIKKRMESEGIEKGTFFKLKTRGTPISIRVEAPNLKSNRSSKQLSLQTVMELQVSLELSDNATKKLCSTIRTGLNRRDSVEENIVQKLENLKEQLDEFYSVEQVEFISNQNEAIIRDLVYIKNPSDLILHIIKERGINPCVGFVRVSLDGGGDFLKVVVNIFEEQESENKFMNSGVQKVLIIAIVEDIPEKYENLRLVLEKLSLEDVNYYIAFYLKCANVLFGLSSHAGKKACLWCSGECTLDKGTLRTIDNIDSCYEAYIKNGSIRSSMKEFDNIVNKRLIYLNTNKNIVLENLVAPPELHLLIGAVDKIAGFLLTEWDGFDLWLKKHYIVKRGYHGVGWDGNNANKILKLIDELQLKVQLKVPYLLPVIQSLRTFKSVKEACFGRSLDSNSEHKI